MIVNPILKELTDAEIKKGMLVVVNDKPWYVEGRNEYGPECWDLRMETTINCALPVKMYQALARLRRGYIQSGGFEQGAMIEESPIYYVMSEPDDVKKLLKEGKFMLGYLARYQEVEGDLEWEYNQSLPDQQQWQEMSYDEKESYKTYSFTLNRKPIEDASEEIRKVLTNFGKWILETQYIKSKGITSESLADIYLRGYNSKVL